MTDTRRSLAAFLLVASVGAACVPSSTGSSSTTTGSATTRATTTTLARQPKPDVTIPDAPAPAELQIEDLVVGTGADAAAPHFVTIDFVGIVYSTKKEFDSSYGRTMPFGFGLGSPTVLPGFNQGVAGMKVGGRRKITMPANLAYGATGRPGSVGPNEAVVYVVDLLAVR